MQKIFLLSVVLLSVLTADTKPMQITSCMISHEKVKHIKRVKPKANLKNYFSSRDDMCEGTDIKTCTNGFESIRNLQIALNHDKKLNVQLQEDGQWGANTKKAVEAYQKLYDISPIDGWVGRKVKKSLDITAKDVMYPSDYFSRHDDMCESIGEHSCTNGYNAVRNLQIALNKNKYLKVKLTVDGEWGEATKRAVITYQKHYKLIPIDGWVGKGVKESLDQTSKGILFPKDKVSQDEKGVDCTKKTYCLIQNIRTFASFKKRVNLQKSFKIYKNAALLRQSTRSNTKITIDISTQRVTLLVKNRVALNAPCTTGAEHKFEPNTKIYRDKHTPTGNYKIQEKIRDKRSTIFGNYYKNGKRIYHGDKRKYTGSKVGIRYVGASLKYWMRITGGGIGLHESKYVKRYPGTNGCIRLQHAVARVIFSKVHVGTKVLIKQ